MSLAKQVCDEFHSSGQLQLPADVRPVAFSRPRACVPGGEDKQLALLFPDDTVLLLDTVDKQLSVSTTSAVMEDYGQPVDVPAGDFNDSLRETVLLSSSVIRDALEQKEARVVLRSSSSREYAVFLGERQLSGWLEDGQRVSETFAKGYNASLRDLRADLLPLLS
jgi:hypothetical protein